jgi:16S rRNA (cytosine967-C5)-methyltransferase
MISPARQVAYDLLCRIELQQTFSDYALNSPAMERLQRPDKNLVTEIVYGTLRWQGFLDYFAAAAASRPWKDVQPEAKIVLRMAIYQMARMNRIPDRALVHDAVEIAKTRIGRGASGFVNAVLRSLSRDRPWRAETEIPEWEKFSFPEWLWKRWNTRFGQARTREYALSLNEPPQHSIRISDIALSGEILPSDIVPGAGLAHRSERVPVQNYQDEASQLIPHLLGDIAGWTVWDACAAPGGKTAILRRLVGEKGSVVSSDANPGRAARMSRSFTSTGRHGIVVADARCWPPFRRQFDAVLVDAPCSGLGTLRRNPEIKWRFQPERLVELHDVQKTILNAASGMVRPGGRILYSTCSTEPEEGEMVVSDFLAANPGFSLLRPGGPAGIEAWLDESGRLKTFPSGRLWDGFFAALMARHF